MQSGKLLVACPTCEEAGRKQILGEIRNGYFIIMRFHHGYTYIRGEFEVLCDICKEPVYFRSNVPLERRPNEMLGIGSAWFSRVTSGSQVNPNGTSGTNFI